MASSAFSRIGSVAGGSAPNSTSGTSTSDVGLQPLLVDDGVLRREIPRRRQPERAAVGQLHQLLCGGTAKRPLADECRAPVRRRAPRRTLRRRPTCRCRRAAGQERRCPPSFALGFDRCLRRSATHAWRARRCATNNRAAAMPSIECTFRGAAQVDEHLFGALLAARRRTARESAPACALRTRARGRDRCLAARSGS